MECPQPRSAHLHQVQAHAHTHAPQAATHTRARARNRAAPTARALLTPPRGRSIGKSSKGVDLWGLEISHAPGKDEKRPNFKYIANMHGDEPSGRCVPRGGGGRRGCRQDRHAAAPTSCCSGRRARGRASRGARPRTAASHTQPPRAPPVPRATRCTRAPRRRMLLPMLAEWLCEKDGKDKRAIELLSGVHLFVLPTVNPDGFETRRRANA